MNSISIVLMLSSGLVCESVSAWSHSNLFAWRQFKQQYGKVYATQEEEARRFAIFMSNKQLIDQHNVNASGGFTLAPNRMSGQTFEEYEIANRVEIPDGMLNSISSERLKQILGPVCNEPLPDEFDWRNHERRVGAVGNQGDCAASWAFATTGLLEGQEMVRNMTSFVPLSQQLFLDCSQSVFKCGGGWVWCALDDLVTDIGGIESELDYPFTGEDQRCRTNTTSFLPLKVKGWAILPDNDEQTLKKTLVCYGPVAVTFKASWNFLHYGGGFFEDHKCYTRKKNHSALVVGYGKDPQKGEYWIIKNSWSNEWGEQGYIRFKAAINMCSISDFSIIATF